MTEKPASITESDPLETAPVEGLTLTCAGCSSVIVSESKDAARGLAWLHMQDCQGGGVL